ncbi:MAG: hypothetical protein RIN56_01075 [Sporomusaceae bacterium]|nr:hypothetical protein [Sporomusaceae bacterium]
MSEYIYITAALLAALHALTYARWLRMNGNKTGAFGVLVIILISLILPVYRLLLQ